MLYGVELAQRLAERLVADAVTDRPLVMQMPGWTSRSPGSGPAALGIVRGAAWHIVATLDIWSALGSPPPSLAGRFARKWSWSQADGPDVAAIAADLSQLASAWWAEHPEDVGVVDVTGALTNALGSALGVARGAFGNVVYSDPKRGEVPMTVRCGIGRERPARTSTNATTRWPQLADVLFTDAAGVTVGLVAADGSRSTMHVRSVTELAAALPGIVDTLRATDDACEAWVRRAEEVRGTLEAVSRRLSPPVAGAGWTITDPFDVELGKPAKVVMSTAAPIGGSLSIHATAIAGGVRFEIGRDPPVDVTPPAAVPLDVLARSIVREGQTLRVHRLEAGRRYRVKRNFGAACTGDVVEFREVYEVRPSGEDVWLFFVHPAGGGKASSLTFGADDAELEALDDYLAV